MTWTVVIVDDEAPARRKLQHLLGREPGVRIVGEASNGEEALEVIASTQPDLVFLDIQMAGLDGLEVARRLSRENSPRIVFVTAHDEHAVEAFELCALDYLLKPFSAARLHQTLERISRRTPEDSSELLSSLEDLLERMRSREAGRDRFLVRSRGRLVFVQAMEIDWIEAAANYAELHVGDQVYLIRKTLNALEARLDPGRFARIHRSRIVNLDRVREIQPCEHGDYLVRLEDGTELRMSRRYRSALDWKG